MWNKSRALQLLLSPLEDYYFPREKDEEAMGDLSFFEMGSDI